MRINSRNIRKILERVWTAPTRIFVTFLHSRTTRCFGMNETLTTFCLIQKNRTKDFSYTIFPVKKNKCRKKFKIMRKSLFNYSLYSHPEIANFRVWHSPTHGSARPPVAPPALPVHPPARPPRGPPRAAHSTIPRRRSPSRTSCCPPISRIRSAFVPPNPAPEHLFSPSSIPMPHPSHGAAPIQPRRCRNCHRVQCCRHRPTPL
jgi:hypothetical protein